MPDVAVTVDAVDDLFSRAVVRDEGIDEIGVTAQAVFLHHAQAVRLDADGLVKVLEREPLGVAVGVGDRGGGLPGQGIGDGRGVAGGDGGEEGCVTVANLLAFPRFIPLQISWRR